MESFLGKYHNDHIDDIDKKRESMALIPTI